MADASVTFRSMSRAFDRAADLEDLTHRIYDAALGEDCWRAVLARLADALGAESAVLARPVRQMNDDAIVPVRTDPTALSRYLAHYHERDLVVHRVVQLPPGSVSTDRMVVPADEFRRSEFYNDFLCPQDQETGLFTVLRHDDVPCGWSIWRSRRQGEWQDEHVDLCRRLMPHLRRAMMIETKLAATAAAAPDRTPPETGPALSPREHECLAAVAKGASSKSIARQLGLSARTVDEYVASATRKLDAGSRAEAACKAARLGLIAAWGIGIP